MMIGLTAALLTVILAVAPEKTEPVMPVRTVLFPFREAAVASDVEAKVKAHHVEMGDAFHKGDLLMELDDTLSAQKLLRAEAQLAESVAQVKFSERSLARNKLLKAKNLLGNQDLERSELELELSKARQQTQEANTRLARKEVADCRIVAPFDGRVIQQVARDFEYVRVGQPLMQIVDDTSLLAVIYLDGKRRGQVRKGDTFDLIIDETNTRCRGTVFAVAGAIDSASRSIEIRLRIDNRKRLLAAGMSGVLVSDSPVKEP
ncbi:MAG: efflux RND transporter periplasmic adaptor subunit [Victivallaceae bacterium]|nr:efflux RND transporter periplasmic adaptor subunit [Victivallaceae bacterium]